MELAKTVKKFIEANAYDPHLPLLLAYSGGPDSKALLYGLLEAGYKPHLAHVDHGWREESRLESQILAKEAASLGLPFYATRLGSQPDKNKEDCAREARLAFFQSLHQQAPFQALLFAHHADDLAETALKRIFEGAHLSFLGGMPPVCNLMGMKVWRPLLTVRKKELTAFLSNRAMIGFQDSTNDDPRFLRARLRQTLLPDLSASFGKEIVSNLVLLSDRAYELKEYLDRKVTSIPRLEGEWGVAFNFNGVERLEARHLLKRYIRSRSQIETVLNAKSGLFSSNIYVKSGWIAIFSHPKPLILNEVKNLLRQFNIFLL